MDKKHASDLFLALPAAGWSIGDGQFAGADGAVWGVSGTRGAAIIKATGKSQGEAWLRAAEQAKAYGMLGCVTRGVGDFESSLEIYHAGERPLQRLKLENPHATVVPLTDNSGQITLAVTMPDGSDDTPLPHVENANDLGGHLDRIEKIRLAV